VADEILAWEHTTRYLADRFPAKLTLVNDPCRQRSCDRLGEKSKATPGVEIDGWNVNPKAADIQQ